MTAPLIEKIEINYFIETDTLFIKDGKTYYIPDKRIQSEWH